VKKLQRYPSSHGFAGRAAGTLAVATLFVVAWVAGTVQGYERFGGGEAKVRVAVDVLEGLADAVGSPGPIARSGIAQGGEVVWDLPNLDHPRVDYWVRRFQTDRRATLTRFMERSGRYAPMISEKLAERDMPQDLIYLAMIESGFSPTAYSHAHASGLWQFIAETGQRYGLTVNRVVDERRDPVKSTEAALDYLTYLYNRFDSWYLAAAGYNTGENRVGRIMREVTGSERGTDADFYRIWNRLPRETRDYVPLMIAAARIGKEPEKYGFQNIQLDPPLQYDEIEAEPGTYLAAVARAAGVDIGEVRRLNPHLRNQRVPTNRSYPVRIPAGTHETFATNWVEARTQQAQLAAAQPAAAPAAAPAFRTHRIRRGESLGVIAQRNGVSVAALRQANGLRGNRIIAGQTLRIPTGSGGAAVAASHRVQRGESLSVIARRHGVSVAALRQANGLRSDRIIAGQTLRIPAGGTTTRVATNHQVRQGENLTVIARRHGVTVNDLRQANDLRGDRIRAGQTLRIPTG
jgi:membrane-bound lytic murein transglycosylase D